MKIKVVNSNDKKESIRERRMNSFVMTLYSRYQLDWMMQHSHSLPELINELTLKSAIAADDGDECPNIGTAYAEWEQEDGFGGELWVCFEEFCGAELLDYEYMYTLMQNDEEKRFYELYVLEPRFGLSARILRILQPWKSDMLGHTTAKVYDRAFEALRVNNLVNEAADYLDAVDDDAFAGLSDEDALELLKAEDNAVFYFAMNFSDDEDACHDAVLETLSDMKSFGKGGF